MHRHAEFFQEPSLQSRNSLQNFEYDQVEVNSATTMEDSSSRSVPIDHSESSSVVFEHHSGWAASLYHLKTKQKTSDDCPPQLHNTKFMWDRRYESSIWDWKWEIMSMVSSLGLLGGVCMTLARYHHSQQPEWPFNININSLVAVITTVLIAQLVFILAERMCQSFVPPLTARLRSQPRFNLSWVLTWISYPLFTVISQLKWSWFQKPHPLQDLEHYDAASRGQLGALAFLCRFVGQPQA